MSITITELDGILPLIARGKVRDIYEVDTHTLLFVATDRISAYDVIMSNAVPDKGKILTRLSLFWFDFISTHINDKEQFSHHLVDIPEGQTIFDLLPAKLSEPKYKEQLQDRSLLVRKCKLIPLEVIVRGYITGSAWSEYQKTQTIHSIPQPGGLKESQQLQAPILTPSTKAEQGEHDENISPEAAKKLVGNNVYYQVEKVALEIYKLCAKYADSKGIIIADTKFEFGIDENNGKIILVDEVLTPDSSRFWSKETYHVGETSDSFDKQFLRNWLTENQLKGTDNVKMPENIVLKTRAKYIEAFKTLTGLEWES